LAKESVEIKIKALKSTLLNGYLYRRITDGLLLKCVSMTGSLRIMGEVHEEICGSHRSEPKMRRLIHRHGYLWPSILADYIKYAKRCEEWQRHGPLQRDPAEELQSIVKPWPFRGWAMDLIGKIHPSSSKHHSFIIVAICYFTKWVEAQPMVTMTQNDIIDSFKMR